MDDKIGYRNTAKDRTILDTATLWKRRCH